MKRIFVTLLLTLFVGLNTFAYDFEVDGFFYNRLTDSTCEVTDVSSKFEYYTKTKVIPSTVTYEGITYDVTSIGEKAFYGWKNLTSVTIPNSITNIGQYAFGGCSSLTSITIPNSVTSISSGILKGCSSLEEITIPFVGSSATATECSDSTMFGYIFGKDAYSGGKDIRQYYSPTSYYTFYFPESLKKVTVTGGYICYGAYSNCLRLTSVTIGDSVTGIGDKAFCGCIALTSVTIGNSVTSIGSSAFSSCSALTSVTIPNSVTSIEDGAFSGCSALPSVTIPNSVTNIGNEAFAFCLGLTSLSIGNSVSTIGYSAFNKCTSLTSVNVSDLKKWCEIKFYDNTSNPLYYAHHLSLNGEEIKDLVLPNTITSIGENAFIGYSEMTSVTIPNSVTYIGRTAFRDCSGLTSVTIPNSVTKIEEYVFSGCSNLVEITIPFVGDSVTAPVTSSACFGAKFFCINSYIPLKKVTVTGGNILANTFIGCVDLTSVTLGDSVRGIGSRAFEGCSALTSVTIPNSVTSIGDYAFSGCIALTSVTIGNSVTSIGSSAFSRCSALTSVNIGNSVTSIGSSAFYSCSVLTSVNIPNSVTSIGWCAFSGCSALSSATIGNSVTNIEGGAFKNCSALTSVTIPNFVTSIGSGAFKNCSALSSVTIGNSVTSIGGEAFQNCSALTSVTIPNSVTSIGISAFEGCSALTSVTSLAVTPANLSNYKTSKTFGAKSKKYLHILKGLKANYNKSNGWDGFKYVFDDIEHAPTCVVFEKPFYHIALYEYGSLKALTDDPAYNYLNKVEYQFKVDNEDVLVYDKTLKLFQGYSEGVATVTAIKTELNISGTTKVFVGDSYKKVVMPEIPDGSSVADANIESLTVFAMDIYKGVDLSVNKDATAKLYVNEKETGEASVKDITVSESKMTIRFSATGQQMSMAKALREELDATSDDLVDVKIEIAAGSLNVFGAPYNDNLCFNYKSSKKIEEMLTNEIEGVITPDSNNVVKRVVNGRLIIIKNGKKYNAVGIQE